MNCLLLEPDERAHAEDHDGVVRLRGRRRQHADEILKASEGDTLRVGAIDGLLGFGQILRLDREVLELRIALDASPPPKLPLQVVLGLPRPPVFRRLLSTIASLGAESILVAGTRRTEKSFWNSHALEPEAVRERLLLGLEQARDTRMPEVTFQRYFEPLVEEVLPRQIEGRRALLPHPGSEAPCPHAIDEPVTVFVGPEGGFLDYEVERLSGIGFEPVALGERVLRVEPVIPLLVGRLFR
ncbi:MAG: 16S rRNA (uracil(1498)-N(3))-methyltransferase [Myxococcota bacterium]